MDTNFLCDMFRAPFQITSKKKIELTSSRKTMYEGGRV